jgi:[ribosomal protein S18]-alanine N-acetyltransferase
MSAKPFQVDEMTPADVEAVAALEQASFNDPWPIESFIKELNTNQLALYLVLRHQDRVVAYVGAWVIIDEVHITTLAVEEEYRRQGMATRLIETLIEKVLPYSATSITLEVRPSNIAARTFYEKLGFEIYGCRRRYYKDEDALIMTKTPIAPEDDLPLP